MLISQNSLVSTTTKKIIVRDSVEHYRVFLKGGMQWSFDYHSVITLSYIGIRSYFNAL